MRAVTCGAPVSAEILAWARDYSEQHGVNMVIDDGKHAQVYSSDAEFRAVIAKIYNLGDDPVDQ
jgi:hypothetical protein